MKDFFLANHTTMYNFFGQWRSVICFVFFNATFMRFIDVFWAPTLDLALMLHIPHLY